MTEKYYYVFPDSNVTLPQSGPGIDVLELGVIQAPTGKIVIDSGGFEIPEMAPLEGWHVNIWADESIDLSQYEQCRVYPKNPVVVMAE